MSLVKAGSVVFASARERQMTSNALVPKDKNFPLSKAYSILGLCQRHMELTHWRKEDRMI